MTRNLANARLVADSIDRVITIEMRPQGVPRGVIGGLYQAVRDAVGDPLTLRAAQLLLRAAANRTVLIATGAGEARLLPKGETDGPIGAATLARILALGLNARPVLMTPTACVEPLAAALRAYGVSAEILTMDGGPDVAAARALSMQWIDTWQPGAMVAIELKGAAPDGKLHYMTGRDCVFDARLDQAFIIARERGIPTVGVGDGGNEVGFGPFPAAVAAAHPNGALIASTVATDELVVAAVSNWGCCGLEAMIAFLLGRPDLIHGDAMGVAGLESCAAAGGVDGIYLVPAPMEDGQPSGIHIALMTIMRHVVENGLKTVQYALDMPAQNEDRG